ncbi:hypothetical protein ACIGBL_01835 [Streptomyces sp. NPDC085614]|uniref:hypothetical protein n=1 Tax=Streptomyces sp. NPDC085614 TaxID=3365733 RepID=UPI0037CDD207
MFGVAERGERAGRDRRGQCHRVWGRGTGLAAGPGGRARGFLRGAVVERDHRVPGEDPGGHPTVAGLAGGQLGGGEPAEGVALVTAVVLDDRDEPCDPGSGPG